MALPMVIAKQRAKRNTFGGARCSRARSNTNGVPMIASVSFIRKAEAIPMLKIVRKRSFLVVNARWKKVYPRNDRYPDSSSA